MSKLQETTVEIFVEHVDPNEFGTTDRKSQVEYYAPTLPPPTNKVPIEFEVNNIMLAGTQVVRIKQKQWGG